MTYHTLSDKAVSEQLGERFRALRLRHNMTQQELADATSLSLGTIKALEAGKGKIATMIAVMRELNCLDDLQSLLPPPIVSPIQLARTQGRPRQRASGERQKKAQKPVKW